MIRNILIASLFIVAFFMLFAPFGFSRFDLATRMVYSLLFGAISFGVAILYSLFTLFVLKLPKDKPQWTFGHWLLDVTVLILLISLGNHFGVQWLNGHSFSWNILGKHVLFTFAVGIFPTTISGFITSFQALRQNQHLADTLTPPSNATPRPLAPSVTLPSTQDPQALTVSISHLLYLEAMENYVAVHYTKDDTPQRTLLRNTLTRIEAELPASFFRCHRSFIVNLDQITDIQGNAQGLKLSLTTSDAMVPVSRKYIPEFKDRWA